MNIEKHIYFSNGKHEHTDFIPVDDIMTAYARCINMAREDYKSIDEDFRSYYDVIKDDGMTKNIVECNNDDGVIVIIDGRKFINEAKPIK